MAHFLLFLFVFTIQLVAGFSSTQKLPPPEYGNMITVLSIDGGGIKGILPATVLDHLDKALKARDPNANIAQHFDVIAGTSTGGLIAAMLASPSPNNPNRPGFTPEEIVGFYKENGPHIFNATGYNTGPIKIGSVEFDNITIGPIVIPAGTYGPFQIDNFTINLPLQIGPIYIPDQIGPIYIGPKFDGEFLHGVIRKLLNETRLNETLTNVVIPTFDIKKQKPVIFSNYKLDKVPYLNAKMSDICIATSAVPSQLPGYYFENDGVEFNMVDGAFAAANPTQAAISEVRQHNKYTKILLLSLGTGATKVDESKYNVNDANGWLSLQWIAPALELKSQGSTDMTEHYLATEFSGLQPAGIYLRIQEYDLDPSVDASDASEKNMNNLEEAGKKLLQEDVTRINVDTFELEKTGEGTYAEALDRLANILYEEKELRLKRKSMEKRGRPFIETI